MTQTTPVLFPGQERILKHKAREGLTSWWTALSLARSEAGIHQTRPAKVDEASRLVGHAGTGIA